MPRAEHADTAQKIEAAESELGALARSLNTLSQRLGACIRRTAAAERRARTSKRDRNAGSARHRDTPAASVALKDEPVHVRLEDSVRRVDPYNHKYVTHCKGRWVGRALGDVFSREFAAEPHSVYLEAIAAGRITVSGKPVAATHVLRDSDVIVNRTRMDEPDVPAVPVLIIHADDDFVVSPSEERSAIPAPLIATSDPRAHRFACALPRLPRH